MPSIRLKAVQKMLSQEKPVEKQISFTERPEFFSRYRAVFMRVLRMYS